MVQAFRGYVDGIFFFKRRTLMILSINFDSVVKFDHSLCIWVLLKESVLL